MCERKGGGIESGERERSCLGWVAGIASGGSESGEWGVMCERKGGGSESGEGALLPWAGGRAGKEKRISAVRLLLLK